VEKYDDDVIYLGTTMREINDDYDEDIITIRSKRARFDSDSDESSLSSFDPRCFLDDEAIDADAEDDEEDDLDEDTMDSWIVNDYDSIEYRSDDTDDESTLIHRSPSVQEISDEESVQPISEEESNSVPPISEDNEEVEMICFSKKEKDAILGFLTIITDAIRNERGINNNPCSPSYSPNYSSS